MLELTCRLGQSLVIGDPESVDAAIQEPWTEASLIEVTVLEVREDGERGGNAQVRLGINAPPDVAVHRKEIYLQIQQENEAASRRPTSSSGSTPSL